MTRSRVRLFILCWISNICVNYTSERNQVMATDDWRPNLFSGNFFIFGAVLTLIILGTSGDDLDHVTLNDVLTPVLVNHGATLVSVNLAETKNIDVASLCSHCPNLVHLALHWNKSYVLDSNHSSRLGFLGFFDKIGIIKNISINFIMTLSLLYNDFRKYK